MSAKDRKAAESKTRRYLLFYVKLIFLWSPAVTTIFVLAFARVQAFFYNWLVGFIISTVAASFCFWGVISIEEAEARVRRWLNRPISQHGHMWSFLLALMLMPFGLYLGFTLVGVLGPPLGYRFSPPDFSDYREGLMLGMLVCTLFFFVESRREAKVAQHQAELRLKEAENERLKAQLASLTAQMNPHLLFNALNTIASLARSDPEVAEEMTVQLSELLRGVLSASKKEMHSLDTELQLCSNYLEVEKARFGSRLRTKIDVDARIDTVAVQVPVLTIQPLIENAVKYAVSPRSEGGEISVNVAECDGRLQIVVADDGPGIGSSTVPSGSGTGIENCRSRLKMHYGQEANLVVAAGSGGGTQVKIVIPARGLPAAEDDKEKGESTSGGLMDKQPNSEELPP